MTIDARKLERLRDEWDELNLEDMYFAQQNMWSLRRITEGLGEMGLDLAQDASYELVADGLTKAVFDRVMTVAAVRHVNNQYFSLMGGGRQEYVEQHYAKRMHGIEEMYRYALPHAQECVKANGMPAELSPIEKGQFAFITEMDRSGALRDEMKQAAAAWAICEFRGAFMYKDSIKPGQPVRYDVLRSGLGLTESALKSLDKAGGYYKPCDIPVDRGMRGFEKNGRMVPYSREAIEDLRRFFLVAKLGEEFTTAKKYQDEGHFVLDSSGGGFGAMVMPMQRILESLKEYGRDIADPATYKEFGTDIDIFRACYERERTAVLNDEKYKAMVKPQFRL